MNHPDQTFIFFVNMVAEWLNRRQQKVIDYLVEENRVLRSQFKGKNLRLTDDQRRRLAVKGRILGRELLEQVASLVTPDTILAWHRKLVARKWDYSERPRRGRPPITKTIVHLVLRMALQNPTWGYTRIEGALKNLGLRICPTSIRNILKGHGIEPAPERRRKTSCRMFLKAHWESIAAADFFTTEVWTLGGLVTYYTVFVIELFTRRAHIGGTTTNPDGAFMRQVARNWMDHFDGFLLGKRLLIHDRDTKWTRDFVAMLKDEGVDSVRCPARAPICNAYAERFIRSLKEECLDRMLFFGEESLRRALREFAPHYHRERNQQGLGNELLPGSPDPVGGSGAVKRRERLGGLLSFYRREAA